MIPNILTCSVYQAHCAKFPLCNSFENLKITDAHEYKRKGMGEKQGCKIKKSGKRTFLRLKTS